jgi:LPXTG-motif cell wall-anchored protein
MFLRQSRLVPMISVGLVAAVSLFAVSNLASAAELTNVTLDVTVSPTSVDPGDTIRTDVEFCVPDSATAGDTFSLTLATQLTQLPSSITLKDPDGAVVAVATIGGTPAVATFELTSYVDQRVDVCGTAFFESRLSSSVAANTTQTLTFVLSGGATYDTDVTVGNPDIGIDRTTARKSGVFTDTGDQCRTTLDSCMSWFVESRPGPFASVTITDDGLVDASFVCSSLSVRLWTLNPDGTRAGAVLPGAVGATISTQDCTASSVDVTVLDVPDNVIVRSLVNATPSFATAGGDVSFQNVASVTHVDGNSGTTTDTVTGRFRSSAAGGEASGVVPPSTTTTTTTSPATTTTTTTTAEVTTTSTEPEVDQGAVTTTTMAPATTTTAAAAGAATTTLAPVLPATGQSSGSLVIAAFVFALAGVAMVAASRRRPVA